MEDIKSEKNFLSDTIKDEYKDWHEGSFVFIETPTGSGKTTFVLNALLPWAVEQKKKILYLVPRAILKRQLQMDFKSILAGHPLDFEEINSAFDIMTMQALAASIKERNYDLLAYYDYVVVDEAHSLLSDSGFNPDMEIVYEVVKKSQNATRLFMSATIEDFKAFVLDDVPGLIFTIEVEVGKDEN